RCSRRFTIHAYCLGISRPCRSTIVFVDASGCSAKLLLSGTEDSHKLSTNRAAPALPPSGPATAVEGATSGLLISMPGTALLAHPLNSNNDPIVRFEFITGPCTAGGLEPAASSVAESAGSRDPLSSRRPIRDAADHDQLAPRAGISSRSHARYSCLGQ